MSSECIPLNQVDEKMTEIIFKDSLGNFPQAYRFNQTQELGGYAIGNFLHKGSKNGTGFVLKKIDKKHPIVALILTAAHIFVSNFIYIKELIDFKLGSDVYEAYPLKDFLNWNDLFLRYEDPLSGVRISVPEDWVLCELRQKPGLVYRTRIVSIDILDPALRLNADFPVWLAGFPSSFNVCDINYICPEATLGDYDTVNRCLLDTDGIILTKGVVIMHREMVAISCASANGMSGGPLLVKDKGKFKAVAFLHGGPATIIHYCVSELLSHRNAPSLSIFEQLADYLFYKYNMTLLPEIKHIFKSIRTVKKKTAKSGKINGYWSESLLKCAYRNSLNVEYSTNNPLRYNLAIPFTTIFPEIEKMFEVIDKI